MPDQQQTDQPTMATAETLRKAYGGRDTVHLPRAGMSMAIRRPDLADAIAHGLLPLPLLKAVLIDAEFAGMLGLRDDQQELAAIGTDKGTLFIEQMKPETMQFVDAWVRLAAVRPQVVATQAEEGPDALWVMDLPLEDKMAIFARTFSFDALLRSGGGAARTFRGDRGDGAAPGPSGATVSVPSLGAVGDR